MAKAKGRLDSIKRALGAASARIPFLPKRPPAAAEPFSAIEDDTPLGDLLSSTNAAPSMVAPQARERPDLRGLARGAVEAASTSPPLLIGLGIVLAFLLLLAATALIVSAPPKAAAAAAPITREGRALVATWLAPPGDPLEPRMAMEREGAAAYTAEDAARLGLHADPPIMAELRDKNDKAIEDLLGTAP